MLQTLWIPLGWGPSCMTRSQTWLAAALKRRRPRSTVRPPVKDPPLCMPAHITFPVYHTLHQVRLIAWEILALCWRQYIENDLGLPKEDHQDLSPTTPQTLWPDEAI